jgi:OmpA-OmpF porin, OOP family
MRMKQILLASSALAVLAGVQQAQAASDMYVSVFGGANFLKDHSSVETGTTNNVTGFDIDPDTGFVIGGAIGTSLSKWAKGLRVELEGSYRRNDVGGFWFTDADIPTTTDLTGGPIEGNMSTFAIMANVWYEIDLGSKLRPYVGGGVGWSRTHYEAAFLTTTENGTPTGPSLNTTTTNENSGFAWQLGVGFNYEVAPDVDVGLGYRYFVGPRVDPFFTSFDGFSNLDNENHTVHVNLTVGIN